MNTKGDHPMTRLFTTKLSLRLGLPLGLGLALALSLAAGHATADDKCTIATKGDSPIAKACAKGGRAEAKKTMKEAVKTAKANGKTFTCENCHKDLDNYELTKNARDDFPSLMAAQKK
jgi:hypothetical protein